MKKNKSQEIPSWAKTGHAKPVTRRELLAHGIIPFAGTLFAPQMMQLLLSSVASAQTSTTKCVSAALTFTPFVHLNLSGGAAMSSNFVPMDEYGQLLPSYNKMGLGDNKLVIEKEFGGGTFAGMNNGTLISKMLEGIRSAADADTISRTTFIGICTRSRDDSSENAANISGLVAKAGLSGTHLPNMGTRSSLTGVNDLPAVLLPPTPLVVRSFRDITNSLGYSAAIGTQLNDAQRVKLAKLVSGLSQHQSRKLASMDATNQLQTLVECAGIKNTALVQEGTAAVNPVQNAGVASVWQLNSGSNQASSDYIFGSMVFNALMGHAGATGLEMGGFDYHDNSRNTGDTRDRGAGVTMGRILQTAKVLQKPVFLYVTSDGAVNSPVSESRNAPWTSDRGSAGAAYIFMYNPAKRPAVSANQIGHFTEGQTADDKFVIGNDPSRAAQAVFANYLQFNKRLGDFNKIVGRNALDASEIAQVLKVA